MVTTSSSRAYLPLPPAELATALAGLPGWQGDTHRLRCTVHPADPWAALEQVAACEAELDHHTVVELDAGAVTFVLWTHVRDAVTGVDVELAGQISRVLAAGDAAAVVPAPR